MRGHGISILPQQLGGIFTLTLRPGGISILPQQPGGSCPPLPALWILLHGTQNADSLGSGLARLLPVANKRYKAD